MTAKPKTQVQKFREAARQAETDDSEDRFNSALRQVSKPSEESKPELKKPAK
jgi:hypothetical protein